MHAHVNIWRLNDAGASTDDSVAREVAAALSRQPGFRSYTLVRTGEREVVAMTLFDSEGHLEAAVKAVADLVRVGVEPLAAGPPERRRGAVVHHSTA
jgi:heme-degrading monooxygenase HmoA